MNDILRRINDFSQVVLDVYKENYSSNLFKSPKEETLDLNNFYHLIKKKYYPPLYFLGDSCYLNTNFFNKEELISIVPLSIFSFLTNADNPLKIGFIELEITNLKNKYAWQDIKTYFEKEKLVADTLSKTILTDLPLNTLSFENEIDYLNYLRDEKGSKIALFYHSISKKMYEKYKYLNKNFTREQFINFYNKLNYDDIIDEIYDFVTKKIR